MKLFRYFFMSMFVAGMLFLSLHKQEIPGLDPFPAAKSWQEVGRKVLVDQSWDMTSPTVWGMAGVPHAPQDMRVFLEGSFQASDPAVKMMVGKMPSASFLPDFGTTGPAFRIAVSPEGYFFGFYPPREPSPAGSLPTSALGLAVTAYNLYEASHPSPIHVTAHVEVVIESYCTAVEVLRERQAFAKGLAEKKD